MAATPPLLPGPASHRLRVSGGRGGGADDPSPLPARADISRRSKLSTITGADSAGYPSAALHAQALGSTAFQGQPFATHPHHADRSRCLNTPPGPSRPTGARPPPRSAPTRRSPMTRVASLISSARQHRDRRGHGATASMAQKLPVKPATSAPSTPSPVPPPVTVLPTEEMRLATRVIGETAHPCGTVAAAVRLSDGSVRAVCSNSEIYRVMRVGGEWLARNAVLPSAWGVQGC